MSWRSRRQGAYLGTFGIIVFVVLFILVYPIIFKDPTCTDKKQNGDETGVDCGGSCALYCPKTVTLPKVDFAAVFPVEEDVYNAVALLTSVAPNAASRSAPYTFTLYDEAGKVIIESKGTTFIPAASQFAVFQPLIRTGARVPVRARFTWGEDKIQFEKINFNSNTLPIESTLFKREKALGTERLSVSLNNLGFQDIKDADYIVIVYDDKDEPIAVSKTRAEIAPKSSTELFFSWPYEFSREPKRYELIKRINPFDYAK